MITVDWMITDQLERRNWTSFEARRAIVTPSLPPMRGCLPTRLLRRLAHCVRSHELGGKRDQKPDA